LDLLSVELVLVAVDEVDDVGNIFGFQTSHALVIKSIPRK